jgi:hypothetical protein
MPSEGVSSLFVIYLLDAPRDSYCPPFRTWTKIMPALGPTCHQRHSSRSILLERMESERTAAVMAHGTVQVISTGKSRRRHS